MSGRRVVAGNLAVLIPVPRIHIEPLIGTLREVWFDTVSHLGYAIAIEETEEERWMLCYVT
jgi:hypothetical protein